MNKHTVRSKAQTKTTQHNNVRPTRTRVPESMRQEAASSLNREAVSKLDSLLRAASADGEYLTDIYGLLIRLHELITTVGAVPVTGTDQGIAGGRGCQPLGLTVIPAPPMSDSARIQHDLLARGYFASRAACPNVCFINTYAVWVGSGDSCLNF